MMYSVYSFGRMISDSARANAYAEALRRSVRPGSVVVDLGAGTGAFSLLAARLGARMVYAIETSPALAIAAESAAANGLADRISFFPRVSTSVELPERADVLVSDLRGTLPLLGRHIPAIADARARFLRPGGAQIPQRDELWVAPVADPEAHRELTEPWSAFGLDMGAARRYAVNVLQARRIPPEHLAAEPKRWAEIDYLTVADPAVTGAASWTIGEPTTVTGLGLWFTAHLLDGLSYSTSPDEPSTVYGMMYAPLAEELGLRSGDDLRVRLRADLVADEYVWTWTTEWSSGDEVRSLRQSTFLAMPPPLVGMDDRAAGAKPELGDQARAAVAALGLIDGSRSIGEIADELHPRYAELFRNRAVAVRFVADLAEQYARWGSGEGHTST